MSNQDEYSEYDNQILEILYNIFKEQDEVTTKSTTAFADKLTDQLTKIDNFLKNNIDNISPALKEELPDVFLKIKTFCTSAEVSLVLTIANKITDILKRF